MPPKESTKHIPKFKLPSKAVISDNPAEQDLDNEREDESSPDQTEDDSMDETPMKSVKRNRDTLGTRHTL